MRVLITGVAGFVGATIAHGLREHISEVELAGIDNFIRPGSETNRLALARVGARVIHADVRQASDFETLPVADWVIDAAANPSVLAGVDGRTSSRQVVEHNLGGTVNVLEYCRRHRAGLILLSTSRVYSIVAQASLPLKADGNKFVLDAASPLPSGVSAAGIDETFSTEPPLSLYGATKRASEQLALEYASAFGFPVWIDRCGVLAGAGQFARPDQGIFSYWIHCWAARRPLKYIGFGGRQVRDVLHPRDLVPLLARQMQATDHGLRTFNVSGGVESAASLRQVSEWCARRFGAHDVVSAAETRPFDLAWTVLDSAACKVRWNWAPATPRDAIFEEIAAHAEGHPEWLDVLCAVNRELTLLSVIIPARDEEGCIARTVEHLDVELRHNGVPHEIVVVDDGSSDRTWAILEELAARMPALKPVQNTGAHGFGRAVISGLDRSLGDAVVVTMADESDDCRDVVRYWNTLNEGWDCVFGSRFVKGGGVIDYPWVKLRINRFVNTMIRWMFGIRLNDTTNAFKAYRRTVIDGCRPLLAPHFNLTVELPLKAIVRGYRWTVIPITWRNRRAGDAKLKLTEMGSRYFFIVMYVWLEKYFSRGDYKRPMTDDR